MSVIIKTMSDLPEHCYDCPCHDGESGYCQADEEHRYSDYRPFWCPLVKISAESEIHCNCTDEEITKSFIEDVEAVKDLLSRAESEE